MFSKKFFFAALLCLGVKNMYAMEFDFLLLMSEKYTSIEKEYKKENNNNYISQHAAQPSQEIDLLTIVKKTLLYTRNIMLGSYFGLQQSLESCKNETEKSDLLV